MEEAHKAVILLSDARLKQGELYRVQISLINAQVQAKESGEKYLEYFRALEQKYNASGCQVDLETRLWTCVQTTPRNGVVPAAQEKSSKIQETKEIKEIENGKKETKQ